MWLFGLLAAAFAVRLGMAAMGRVASVDENIYWEMGRALLQDGRFTLEHWPWFRYIHVPGFPAALGLLGLIFSNPEFPATFLYLACGSLLVLPIYGLGARLYGERAGLYAAGIVAILPMLTSYVLGWHYGSLTEPPFNLLVFTGLHYLLRGQECGCRKSILLGGLALGLSYMVRVEGVIYAAFFGLWLLYRTVRDGRLREPKALQSLVLCAAAMGVVILPYVLWLHAETGRWMLSGKNVAAFAFYTGGTADMDPQEFARKFNGLNADKTAIVNNVDFQSKKLQSFGSLVMAQPLKMAKLIFVNWMAMTKEAFTHKVFPALLLPFLGLGLFGAAWGPQRVRREGFLALSLAPVALLISALWLQRYFSPAVPTLALWTGAGLSRFDGWWEETAAPAAARWAKAALALLRPLPHVALAVYLLGISVARPLENKRQATDPWEYKIAAAWMMANLPDLGSGALMTLNPQPAWYSGAHYVPLPYADWADTLRFARHQGVRYLYVDEFGVPRVRPQLAFLLKEAETPPELEVVRVFDDYRRRAVLYRLRPE